MTTKINGDSQMMQNLGKTRYPNVTGRFLSHTSRIAIALDFVVPEDTLETAADSLAV